MSLSCKNNVKRSDSNERPPATSAIYADICYVSDRSGSMVSMGNAPIKGLKQFISDQKENMGNKGILCSFTLCTFDNVSEEKIFKNIQNCNITDDELEDILYPRGCTRLIDTAIEQIEKQNKRVEDYMNSLSPRVRKLNPNIIKIFAIMTDGFDNVSKKHARDLHNAITKARENNTTCMFLAANQDAIGTGIAYGFSATNSLNVGNTPLNMTQAIRSVSNATCRHINGEESSFTPAERSVSQATAFSDMNTVVQVPYLTTPPFLQAPTRSYNQLSDGFMSNNL
ncbi:MAG: hypothetical protein CBB97_24810 [Candidatus Endolissoclinum sp. TMED37]|nr:MAG: hypothetical protein CBB97_24810 [Candidatus Endolissoclinum sp. TMED37]|tara:strand:+ start:681 stop:1529 length:849 start_codon:yes stop_codon:yes gene_type:complete